MDRRVYRNDFRMQRRYISAGWIWLSLSERVVHAIDLECTNIDGVAAKSVALKKFRLVKSLVRRPEDCKAT